MYKYISFVDKVERWFIQYIQVVYSIGYTSLEFKEYSVYYFYSVNCFFIVLSNEDQTKGEKL